MQYLATILLGWIAVSALLGLVWVIAASVGYRRAVEDVRQRATAFDGDDAAEDVTSLEEVDRLVR